MVRKRFLQKVVSFTKLVPQTLRTHIWQKRSKFSPRRRNLFAQDPKNLKIWIFPSNEYFVKLFPRTRKRQFWEPWEIKFHQMTENVSLNLQKDQKNSLLHLKWLLVTSRKQFWQRRRKFFDKSQNLFVHYSKKMVRKRFLQKVVSFTKLVPQTLRTHIWQKRSKFSPRRRNLFAQDAKEIRKN